MNQCTKAHDLQQRPVTPSSGLCVWQWNTPVKADYYDYHRYANTRGGWPDSVVSNWDWYDDLKRIYSEVTRPVINGECVGGTTRRTARRDILALATKERELDKAKYVAWANKVSQSDADIGSEWNGRLYVRFAGVRSLFRTHTRSRVTADMTARMVRMFRRDMSWLEGFALHDIRPLDYVSAIGVDRSEQDWRAAYEQAAQHPELESLRRALAPQFVTLDMVDRNRFPGTRLETDLHLLNNLYGSAGTELVATVSLQDTRDRTLHTQKVRFPNVPEHARLKRSIAIPLAAGLPSADYTIRTTLLSGNRPINQQTFPLFVGDHPGTQPAVRSTGQIALYEQGTGTGAIGAIGGVLGNLRIRHARLPSFTQLARHDVLILGPNSLDERVVRAGATIRNWLQQGGRLVCFEQTHQGALPFLDTLRYDRGEYFIGDRFFGDAIEPDHPVLHGLAPHHWELWNGGRRRDEQGVLRADTRAVYDSIILPMTGGVIVAGATGPRYGKRSPTFGMIACEHKVGRGLVFLSQALAVKRYHTDSVARRYVNNVLQYTLENDWTGRYASP